MKTFLIFDTAVSGHHMEYINNLYMKALENKNCRYVFSIPKSFDENSGKFSWPEAEHLKISLFDYNPPKGRVASILYFSKKLKDAVRKEGADEVFIISLMNSLPFTPFLFLFNRKIKISGVVYLIYLYREYSSLATKIGDWLKYFLLSKSPVYKNIFLLNGEASAKKINKKFNCSKCRNLVDPFIPIPSEGTFDFRAKYNIPESNKVYLQFGSLAKRKGIMKIMDAAKDLPDDIAKKSTFVFAGKLNADAKDEFYASSKALSNKTQILIFDEFCEYSFIASACMACDYILVPYDGCAQSSGMFGYAAQYKKPLLSPDKGLFGEIIREYQLGVLLKNCDAKEMLQFFQKEDFSYEVSDSYLKEHTVENFCRTILELDSENI